MKSRLILLVVALCVLCISDSFAQRRKSDPIKPQWIHKLPKPTNNSFTYEIDYAIASTLDEARDKSLASLIANSGFENGVVVISDYESKIVDSQVIKDGKLENTQIEKFEVNSHIHSEEMPLHVKDVAEYWEIDGAGKYHLTKLYARSMMNGSPQFDDVTTTTKYGARGLWRSMIIPGWGQFHKGSYVKGGFVLGGTAILAAGVVFTEGQRADYNKRMFQTYDVNMIKTYQTKRDNFTTARNICISATAALYLYNIIDVIAAPGARRIILKRKDKNNVDLACVPTVFYDGTPMISANVKF